MSSLEEVLPTLSLSEFKEFSRRHYGNEKIGNNILQDVTFSQPIIKFDESNILRGVLPTESFDDNDSKTKLSTSYAAIVKTPNNKTFGKQPKLKNIPTSNVVPTKKPFKPNIILKGSKNGVIKPKSVNINGLNEVKMKQNKRQKRKMRRQPILKTYDESIESFHHTNYFQALESSLPQSSEDEDDTEVSDHLEETKIV